MKRKKVKFVNVNKIKQNMQKQLKRNKFKKY